MIRPVTRLATLLALAAAMVSTTAQAQLFRTYVSLNGNDANPCSLTQPCRLLPAALNAVADGGEVWMLDTANYNTGLVTISKSVSILAVPGVVGSVVATAAGDVIRVDAAASKVALRNLMVTRVAGVGGALTGVRVAQGASLIVEGCSFYFLTKGIDVEAVTDVQVVDSAFRDGQTGIEAGNGASLSVARSTFTNLSVIGILVLANTADITTGAVTDSVFMRTSVGIRSQAAAAGRTAIVSVSRNQLHDGVNGLIADGSAGGVARLVAADNVISRMISGSGITAFGAGSKVVATRNVVTNSSIGLRNDAGVFESRDNISRDNSQDDVVGTLTALATM